MFILMKGHQPGVYVPLGALFLVLNSSLVSKRFFSIGQGQPTLQSKF